MKLILILLFCILNLKAQLPDDFQNTAKIKFYSSMIEHEKNKEVRNILQFKLAQEYLYSGKNDTAIRIFNDLKNNYNPNQLVDIDDEKTFFRELVNYYIALSYFRMGEVQNCVARNNESSCLFPIDKKGQYVKQSGSKHAIKKFTEILNLNPENLSSKWLLNLAHNTLGTYPDEVPSKYLISPEHFKSEYPYEKFQDMTATLGINYIGLAGGVVVDDFNNDGKLDIFYSSISENDPFRVYLNQGNKFKDVTYKSKNQNIKGSLNIISTDFDNDGNIDIFMTRGAWRGSSGKLPAILLKGNGDGSFKNITKSSGIKTIGPSQASAWGDFNNDGRLDLLVAYESEGSEIYPTQLWENLGNGKFKNIAPEIGLDKIHGFFKSVAWGDFNNDGLPDILFSNLKGQPFLLLNRGKNKAGKWFFEDVTLKADLGNVKNTFPAWFFDYDNDGNEDIIFLPYHSSLKDLVNEMEHKKNDGEKVSIFHNNGNGTFTNKAIELNLNKSMMAMGANYGDINNDGYLDLYIGTGHPRLDYLTPNKMFINNEGKSFYDITTATDTGHLQKGHGVAFGDLNNDGAVDLIINQGGFFESDYFKKYVYLNPGNKNNWIKIKLIGIKTNRMGIGAKLKLTIVENGHERFIYRTVNSGGSFGSNPFEQHIGIGKSNIIKELDIFWPKTGKHQKLYNVKINSKLTIKEEIN